METFFGSLESSGGYAILAGAVLVGMFWLSREVIHGAIQRNQEREAEMIRRFDAQMERERLDRETIQGMTDRVILALDGNTRVIATVIEVTRETNERLEAIDRHLERTGGRDAR
jgi:hypothetical protein